MNFWRGLDLCPARPEGQYSQLSAYPWEEGELQSPIRNPADERRPRILLFLSCQQGHVSFLSALSSALKYFPPASPMYAVDCKLLPPFIIPGHSFPLLIRWVWLILPLWQDSLFLVLTVMPVGLKTSLSGYSLRLFPFSLTAVSVRRSLWGHWGKAVKHYLLP